MTCHQLEASLDTLLSSVTPAIGHILDRALCGMDITVEEGAQLFDAAGVDILIMIAAADSLRRKTVENVVTYVVNRNINFTNVCVKAYGFCAFSRGHAAEKGYFLSLQEVVRRAKEAWELGASEVYVQMGLAPRIDGFYYVNLCKAIEEALPDFHIHGFSPEEVLYGSTFSGSGIRDYSGQRRTLSFGYGGKSTGGVWIIPEIDRHERISLQGVLHGAENETRVKKTARQSQSSRKTNQVDAWKAFNDSGDTTDRIVTSK